MNDNELLYTYSSIAITISLFISIIIFNEIGFRAGQFVQSRTDTEVKQFTGSIQASILGLLALLLGFTFSMSMQRFDNRSLAIIEEANAIGTAVLRSQLLPEPYRQQIEDLLQDYIELRIDIGKVDLTKLQERKKYHDMTAKLQNELWRLAVLSTNIDARPVTSGVFIKSLNDLIDSQNKRTALLQLNVPEAILIILFIAFISSGGIMGYSAGLSGKRVIAPIALVSLLITLIVYIIIDLDRPKRGIIQINQNILSELMYEEKHL